jgi:hypothetical protein
VKRGNFCLQFAANTPDCSILIKSEIVPNSALPEGLLWEIAINLILIYSEITR